MPCIPHVTLFSGIFWNSLFSSRFISRTFLSPEIYRNQGFTQQSLVHTNVHTLEKRNKIYKRKGFIIPGLLSCFSSSTVKGQSRNVLVKISLHTSSFCCKNWISRRRHLGNLASGCLLLPQTYVVIMATCHFTPERKRRRKSIAKKTTF